MAVLQTDQKTQLKNYTDDEQIFRSQAKDYAIAFSAGDAKALANMWTEDVHLLILKDYALKV